MSLIGFGQFGTFSVVLSDESQIRTWAGLLAAADKLDEIAAAS